MPRILVLSNIPTPYQMDFLGELSTQCELKAVFLWSREANRDWTLVSPAWLTILNHQKASKSRQGIMEILADFKPDAIIVGGYRLPLAGLLNRLARKRRAKFYYWLEKPLPSKDLRAIARRFMWRLTLPKADGVLGIGSEAVAAYRPFARTCHNLPYAIEAAKYSLRPACEATHPIRFLFVGQFIHRKGIAELLQAFQNLAPEKAALSLAGSGELKPLVDAAVRECSHIHALGFMEPAALAAEFSKHDVFILPSRHDGWAVVVAEAMAAGLPVIGTHFTGAFVDLVAQTDSGITCDVTADSILRAARYYVDAPSEILRQGTNARAAFLVSRAEARMAATALLSILQLSEVADAPAH